MNEVTRFIEKDGIRIVATDREYRQYLHDKRLTSSGKPYIVCLECGRPLRHFASHLSRIHRITGREYFLKYGVPFGERLVASDVLDAAKKRGKQRWLATGFRPKPSQPTQEELELTQQKRKENFEFRLRSLAQIHHAERMPEFQSQAQEAMRRMHLNMGTTVFRNCSHCGDRYKTKKSQKLLFCSDNCYHASKAGVLNSGLISGLKRLQEKKLITDLKRTRDCVVCKKPFVRKEDGQLSKNLSCCSTACYGKKAENRRDSVTGRYNPQRREK